MRRGAGDVTDEPLVRHAALGPGRRRGVVRGCARSLPPVEVGTDRVVPELGETAHDLLAPAVVAGHVVDDDHSAAWPVDVGSGDVRLDLVTVVSFEFDRGGSEVMAHGWIEAHSGTP